MTFPKTNTVCSKFNKECKFFNKRQKADLDVWAEDCKTVIFRKEYKFNFKAQTAGNILHHYEEDRKVAEDDEHSGRSVTTRTDTPENPNDEQDLHLNQHEEVLQQIPNFRPFAFVNF
ncbi:hypothetical protein TNCV_5095861 [Trichonephila clavipes]|nr:hypothetical protein TNCV_5095861 [Trichonephila clavipes]